MQCCCCVCCAHCVVAGYGACGVLLLELFLQFSFAFGATFRSSSPQHSNSSRIADTICFWYVAGQHLISVFTDFPPCWFLIQRLLVDVICLQTKAAIQRQKPWLLILPHQQHPNNFALRATPPATITAVFLLLPPMPYAYLLMLLLNPPLTHTHTTTHIQMTQDF